MLNLKGDGELNTQLKFKRIERGLTQANVAQESGISERSYQRIEAGKITNVYTAIRIADILGVLDLRDLFGAATPDIAKTPDGNPANNLTSKE